MLKSELKLCKDSTLLKGPLLLPLIKLSLPIILANLSQSLYGLTDAFWLGRLSKEAFASTSVTRSVVFFVLSFANGFSISATALVAQYKGANKPEKQELVVGQVLSLFLFFSIIASISGILLTPFILEAIQVPAEIWQNTYNYLVIIFAAQPFAFGFLAYQGSSHGFGNTMNPMKIQFIAVLFNLILDPFLIFGWAGFPAWGVKGAAIATLVARAMTFFMGLYFLIKSPYGLQLKLANMKPDLKMLRSIVNIGLPSALGFASTSLGFVVLNRLVNSFGTVVISAYGVGNHITGIFLMPAMGIDRGLATTVGQNLGACQAERAKKAVYVGMLMVLSVLGLGGIMMFFFGKVAIYAFLPGEHAVAAVGANYFRLACFSVVAFGIFHAFSGAFSGAGRTKPIMYLSLMRLWVLYIPIAYMLANTFKMGSNGIWTSMVISNSIAAIIAYILFLKVKWMKAVIEPSVETPEGTQL